VDQEVAKTLGELELKLQQLEHELTAIGQDDTPADSSHEVPVDSFHGTTGRAHTPADQTHTPTDQTHTPTRQDHTPDGSSNQQTGYHPHTPAEPVRAPGKLIDEAVELGGESLSETTPAAEEQALADGDGDGLGGPPVFGGEEVPSQAGTTVERSWTVEARETAYGEIPTPPTPLSGSMPDPPMPPSGSMPSPPTPFSGPTPGPPASPSGSTMGPPIPPPAPMSQPTQTNVPGPPPPVTPPAPTPPLEPSPQPIDVMELVRFKEKMRRTLDELVDEYSKLLEVDRPTGPHA
jgi:hypothetical protein